MEVKMKNFIVFLAGATVGAAGKWAYDKYAKTAQAWIEQKLNKENTEVAEEMATKE